MADPLVPLPNDPAGLQPLPEPPRVSIVIVTRNQAESLRRCLTALAQSTLADSTQILVVDNNSRDGSNAIQDDFESIIYLKLPKNFGFTKAANIALRSTQAELILFLDPRVELAPTAVAALADSVEAEGEAAAACAWLETPAGAPAAVLRNLPAPGSLDPPFFAPSAKPSEPEPVAFPGLHALMIRKSFLKGMNFLDEHYGELWADAEIAAQVRRAGRKIRMLPAASGVFHESEAPPPLDPALLAADFDTGAATYLSKHCGGGIGYRITSALGALVSFKIGHFMHLLGGQKIDGSHE